MRKLWERIICIFMCSVLFLPMGCGIKKEETQEQSVANKTLTEKYIYVPEFIDLPLAEETVCSAHLSKEALVLATASETEYKIYRLAIGESMPKVIYTAPELMISAIAQNEAGEIFFLSTKLLEEEIAEGDPAKLQETMIVKIDKAGQQIDQIDVTGALSLKAEDYIQKMQIDKEGNYYLAGSKGVTVLKADGALSFEAALPSYISSMFLLRDDRVVIGYLGDMGWKLEVVDLAAKSLRNLESKTAFEYGTYQAGKDTDLLYTMNSMLYAGNLSDGETTQVLKWADVDIDSNNLDSYQMLEDGRIAVFTLDQMSGDGKAEFAILSQKLESEVSQKTILTYGTCFVPYFADQDIVAFNKQSEKYRIEMKLYGENGDYENAMALMNADITAGKGPDIIDLVYSYQDVSNLANKGVLEDLGPYFDGDSEIKRENYLENVLEAYTIGGKLVGVPANVGVDTIVGRTSDVGQRASWTLKDMSALFDKQPESMEFMPYATKASMLSTLCRVGMGKFVNMEEGTSNFEGEGFKEVLEFANRFPLEDNYNPNDPDSMTKVKNKELLLDTAVVTSATLYQMYEFIFEEPVTFIGYPTEEGYGSILRENGTTVGMNAQSANKEGVWEFIRFLLSEKQQSRTGYANMGFPVLKSALESTFAKDLEKKYYEDENGNQQEEMKSTWGTASFSVDIYAAAPEQVETVKELLYNAIGSKNIDQQILTIISEEVQPYFNGQKTVEEVQLLIQNRVQTYINEIS